MSRWTKKTVDGILKHLERVDRLIDSARARMAKGPTQSFFSAAGAATAAALAKLDAIQEFPDIIVGDDKPDIPALDLYELLYRLYWQMNHIRARSWGNVQPPTPSPEDIKRELESIKTKLSELADRDWIDDCGVSLEEVIDLIDELLPRLNNLGRPDEHRANQIDDKIKRFLRCIEDEIDLMMIFWDGLFSIDDALGAAARELLDQGKPVDLDKVEMALKRAESIKRGLMDYLIRRRVHLPDGVGLGPGSGAEIDPNEPGALDLPPIPPDHASVRPLDEREQEYFASLKDVLDVDDKEFAKPFGEEIGAGELFEIELPGLSPLKQGPRKPHNMKGPRGDEQKENKDDDDDHPRDTPPPTIYGEEIDAEGCNGMFVRGIGQNRDCRPHALDLKHHCSGEICGFIWPGSRWMGNVAGAVTEINRAISFYEGYCIHLSLRQLQVSARQQRRMRQLYNRWYTRLIAEIGEDNLGTATIHRRHINPFIQMMQALQRTAVRQGCRLLVVFIDEYLTDWRPSLVSACSRGIQQIGINWVDRNSPYILAHELIHALGKSAPDTPGTLTWDHNSVCHNALSTVDRRGNVRTPVDLSGRYLDEAEYVEILQNRGGAVLSCS